MQLAEKLAVVPAFGWRSAFSAAINAAFFITALQFAEKPETWARGWKSGALAPRKLSQINEGFSPGGRLLLPAVLFQQTV